MLLIFCYTKEFVYKDTTRPRQSVPNSCCEILRNGMKREETGRNGKKREETGRKEKKKIRNKKKREETGRNGKKKQEETG